MLVSFALAGDCSPVVLILVAANTSFVRLPRQSGSGGGNAMGSICQTPKVFPSGSARTAYQPVLGTAVFGRTMVAPPRCARSSCFIHRGDSHVIQPRTRAVRRTIRQASIETAALRLGLNSPIIDARRLFEFPSE